MRGGIGEYMVRNDIFELYTEIPILNDYLKKCSQGKERNAIKAKRGGYANRVKQKTQAAIAKELEAMPTYSHPIEIDFIWCEPKSKKGRKPDLDNRSFGKKFILDAMVQEQKIKDDSPKYVRAFSDKIQYTNEDKRKVIMHIKEVEN